MMEDIIICGRSDQECYVDVSGDNITLYNGGDIIELKSSITEGVISTTCNGNTAFNGKYYETQNNKILTLGIGQIGEDERNAREGLIFALNENDFSYKMEGTFLAEGNGYHRVHFTKGSAEVKHTTGYTYNLEYPKDIYIYVGFNGMIYMEGREIDYKQAIKPKTDSDRLTGGFEFDSNGIYWIETK